MAGTGSPSQNPKPSVSRRTWIIFLLVAVGAACAVAAPLSPWYEVSNTTHNLRDPGENQTINISSSNTFFPGSEFRYYCAVTPANARVWGAVCGVTHPNGLLQPYSGLVFQVGMGPVPSSLGSLYGDVWWLSLFAAISGVMAVATYAANLRLRSRGKFRIAVIAALAIAGALAIGAGLGMAIEQPAAIAHDCPFGGISCSGTSGFWGSCGPTPTSCGFHSSGNLTESTNWGPGLGWYLEIVAGVLMVGGAATLLVEALQRSRPNPPPATDRPS